MAKDGAGGPANRSADERTLCIAGRDGADHRARAGAQRRPGADTLLMLGAGRQRKSGNARERELLQARAEGRR